MLLTDFTAARPPSSCSRVAGPGSGSPQVLVEVRQLGGAYARAGRHPTRSRTAAPATACWPSGWRSTRDARPHARRLFSALAPWDTGGVWPNFGPPHDAATARRAYDPATLARLAAVARTYDPRGVLQAGHYLRADQD